MPLNEGFRTRVDPPNIHPHHQYLAYQHDGYIVRILQL